MRVLSDKMYTAYKSYNCDTRELWERAGLSKDDVKPYDWCIAQTAIRNKWVIEVGDKYRKVVYVEDGKLRVYRGAEPMDGVLERLHLFDE